MKKTFFLPIILLLLLGSCFTSKKLQTTESGIDYKFIEKNKKSRKPVIDDILYMDIKFFIRDSLLFSSNNNGDGLRLQYIEPIYTGDLNDAFSLLNQGDSAIIFLDATKFYDNNMHEVPEFIKEGDMLKFHVRLNKVLTEEEEKEYIEKKSEKQMKNEDKLLAEYLKKNNIETQPTKSGLYYVETEKGTGERATAGHTVKVHYTGYLLNGQVFDSSVERGTPFSFKLGANRVIAGWEEGIALMNVGGKATLIIPSDLGYGARGAGEDIPPYSTIIFDVELLEIK